VKQTVQITGLVIALLYGAIIVWLYVRQPRSFEELKTQAAIEANVYRIKQENFDQAIKHFNAGQHQVAIEQFKLADPAGQDPTTQFLIAYSYYMLGRGNIYDDDELFKKGLEAIARCQAHAPNNIFEIDRADLEIRSAAVLQQRLKEGLESTASDFNPFNWFKR
jgi:tetratricopeptide (TPR) repeat protein